MTPPFIRLQLLSSMHFVIVAALLSGQTVTADEKLPSIQWKMHTINDQSPYEGGGAADFNGDGKIDIFVGTHGMPLRTGLNTRYVTFRPAARIRTTMKTLLTRPSM